MPSKDKKTDKKLKKSIPYKISSTEVLLYLQEENINWQYVQSLKDSTHFKDEIISTWLNISVKTFRSYKKPDQQININIREQVLLLLSLMEHGKRVFLSTQAFEQWLQSKNFHFNDRAPIEYLQTITGIRFVDDRLTALEYGDNV